MPARVMFALIWFFAGALAMTLWDHKSDIARDLRAIKRIRREDPRSLNWFGRLLQILAGGAEE